MESMTPPSTQTPPAGQVTSLEAEQIAQTLSHELMSPYCPGRTISSCPSPNARKLEEFILAEASAGKSKVEIEQGLVETFGREKLGSVTSPPVYLFVGLLALLGGVLLVVRARRWRGASGEELAGVGGGATTLGVSGLSAEDQDRLEDALDDIEEF